MRRGVEVAGFENLSGTFLFTLGNGASIEVGTAFGNEYQVADGEVMAAAEFQAWVEAMSGVFAASVTTSNEESATAGVLEFAGDDSPFGSSQPILEIADTTIPQDLYDPDSGTFNDADAFATAFGDAHALAFG